MIEKIKTISNPLTVIAIFAALAEVAGTVALSLVDKELQSIFVWFVMLFPTLIVSLFFITLNFNPKVLYAPSDFKDEENFLNSMYGANQLSISLKEVDEQIGESSKTLFEEIASKIQTQNENTHSELKQLIESEFNRVRNRVEHTRETAEDIQKLSYDDLPKSAFQAQIIFIMTRAGRNLTAEEISEATNMSLSATKRSLEKLGKRNIVLNEGGEPNSYKLLAGYSPL